MVALATTVPTWVLAEQPSFPAVAELSWASVHCGVAFGSPTCPGGSPTVRSFT